MTEIIVEMNNKNCGWKSSKVSIYIHCMYMVHDFIVESGITLD